MLAAVALIGAVMLLGGGATDEGVEQPRTTTTAPRETVVTFPGADGIGLRGTLRLPLDVSTPVPGVVIIPGFGSTDRNGLAPASGRPDPLYRDLSRTLARAGMASLRYDKRGTGESVIPPGQTLDFDRLVADASAALAFLGAHADVDAGGLAFVGHDEGGLTALRVAGGDPRVRAVVLISTPGRPLVEVLSDDLMSTSPRAGEGEAHVAQLRATVDDLLATGRVPDPQDLRAALRPLFPPGQEAYVRSIFSLDPVAEAAGVDVPVLLVRGDLDLGVSAVDVERLVAALAGETQVLVGVAVGATLARERGAEGGPGVVRDDALLDEVSAWAAGVLGSPQV